LLSLDYQNKRTVSNFFGLAITCKIKLAPGNRLPKQNRVEIFFSPVLSILITYLPVAAHENKKASIIIDVVIIQTADSS